MRRYYISANVNQDSKALLFWEDQNLPKPTLVSGLTFEATIVVTDALTVPNVSDAIEPFADMPPVFATAFMVAHVEATCIACIQAHLGEGEHSVGTNVSLSHTAATPVGMQVTATVRLTEVEGRILTFSVEVRDDAGSIGSGEHKRVIIDVRRFLEKVEAKGMST
jgi:fluoroacetyl-CoA thioesterase